MTARHLIINIALALIATVLFIAATATCKFFEVKNFDAGIGVFDSCGIQLWDNAKCSDLPDTFKDLKDRCHQRDAIRATCVIAIVLSGLLLVWLCAQFWQKNLGKKWVTLGLFIGAATSGLIAMALAANFFEDVLGKDVFKLSAGFVCLTVGWIISLIGAIHTYFGARA